MKMIDEKTGFTLASYVKTSNYRYRVMTTLKEYGLLTPTEICRKTGIIVNHISNVLRQLKEKGLIVCLNEESHKGRLYTLTDTGEKILNDYLIKL